MKCVFDHLFSKGILTITLGFCVAVGFPGTAAQADSSFLLSKALEKPSMASMFGAENGFSFATTTSSDSVTGRQMTATDLNQTTSLVGDQRVYALLIDGKYDFTYEHADISAWHPYVSGGVGMAVFGKPVGTAVSNGLSGDTAPLLRMGGGVAYRLDQKWNMDLNYHTGLTGTPSSGDRIFTGRGQEPVDMQAINMGLKYKF